MGAVMLVLDLPEPSPAALGGLRAWLELLGAHGLRATVMLGAGQAAGWRQQLGPESHARLCQQALGLRWAPPDWPVPGFDHYRRLHELRQQQWRSAADELATACGLAPAALTMPPAAWCPVGLTVAGSQQTTLALDAPFEDRLPHQALELAGVSLIRGHLRINELALSEDATATFGRLQGMLEASAAPGSLLTVHAALGEPGAEQAAFNRRLLGTLLTGREAHRWTCANEWPRPLTSPAALSPAEVLALATRLGERLEPLAIGAHYLTVAQQFSALVEAVVQMAGGGLQHPVYPRRLLGPPAPEMAYTATTVTRDALLASASELRQECLSLGEQVPSAVRVGEHWLPPSAWLRAAALLLAGSADAQAVAARPLPLWHATRREWRELAERCSVQAPMPWRSWVHEWWLAHAWDARPTVPPVTANGGS